jgi:hypothetical protein
MNRLIILLLLLCLAWSLPAQTPPKYDWGKGFEKAIPGFSISLLSGAAGGLNQGLLFRKASFFERFPHASRQYWDPDISWRNKYWRNAPVQFSDGYHFTYSLHNVLLCSAGISATIPIGASWSKQPWKHRILDIVIQSGAISLGYFIGSEGMFNAILYR